MLRTAEECRIVRLRRSRLLRPARAQDDAPRAQWAETPADLARAFRLVHDEYLRLGYLKQPAPHGMFYSGHHLLPSSATAVIKKADAVIATVSFIQDSSSLHLPMDTVFAEELNNLRRVGRRLAEYSGLATGRGFCWRSLFMPLCRLVHQQALERRIDDVCIMVNPKHVAFYQRMLLFEPLGPERHYGRLGAPAVALHMDLSRNVQEMMAAYAHLDRDQDLHRYFYDTRVARERVAVDTAPGSPIQRDPEAMGRFLTKS